jgi:hypothetical protein
MIILFVLNHNDLNLENHTSCCNLRYQLSQQLKSAMPNVQLQLLEKGSMAKLWNMSNIRSQ